MDFIVELASKLKMFKDLCDEPQGEMDRLSCMWSARCAAISRSTRLSILVKKLNGLTSVSDDASKASVDEIRAEITMLENETIEERIAEAEEKRIAAEEKRRQAAEEKKRQAAKASAAAAAALGTKRRKASVTPEQRQAAKASAAAAAAAALATKRKTSVIE